MARRRRAEAARADPGSWLPVRLGKSPPPENSPGEAVRTNASTQAATKAPAIDIALRSLSVRYGEGENSVLALDSVDLEVGHQEFVAVMGPSGCGKTTLLNVIAGFVQATSGVAMIGDRPITAPGPDRAVVFQDDAVFPWMTVEDNVAFSPKATGKSRAETRELVDRYVNLVGLEDFRTAWPAQLSGGMRKRVDLARGYAAKPQVLLLDEPFGSLDIMTKEYLQEELHKLWRAEPKTVILVTHDLEEALFLGDRVVILSPRPGRIVRTYEPNLPTPRDQSIKMAATFVELRREIRTVIAAMGEDHL